MNKKQLLEEFISQNLDCFYRFAYSYTKNRSAAEDVVSEAVVKALKSVHSLRNPEYIKTWFYRIVINCALSYLKKEKKIIPISIEDLAETEGKPDDYSNLDFEQLIEVLEPKYKSIIILRFFENMKLQEIADILRENPNTVKTRLYKGLELLKIEMEEQK